MFYNLIDNISLQFFSELLMIIPGILEIVTTVLFFIFVLMTIAFATLVERKVLASMQRRRGPNMLGLFGLLQPFADGLKLFIKETVLPKDADISIFLLAPIFTFFCSLKIWAAIPFSFTDYQTFSLNGIIYLLIILSLSAYGIIFAGWASNSKYAFLGGLRSTAQMISYEVCLSFIFIIIVMLSQSIDFIDIVSMQIHCWFIVPLLPLWFIFIVCGLAETNRAPFDLPEAEAELVAGYNVEYSALTFALFFLGEYSNIVAFGAVSTLCFWGGWLPFLNLYFIPDFFWFALKITMHVFVIVWIRATFPRYRYDQLMKLGWKVLLPLCLSILFIVAFIFLHIDKYCAFMY
jgi:NADH-quinone oxidoreductase subunit H